MKLQAAMKGNTRRSASKALQFHCACMWFPYYQAGKA